MKKGQGLSINMMILIALGLAVLIISIILISNQTRKGSQTTSDTCTIQGYDCVEASACGDFADRRPGTCADPEQVCCAPAAQPTP